ncbi:MAG: hypothetical protein AAB443_04830 [Patescibacteria group bacterium]
MERIEIQITDDVFDAVKKVRGASDTQLIAEICENAIVFENALNLKLIKKEAEKSGKSIVFETEDAVGKNLIAQIDGTKEKLPVDASGFITSKFKVSSEVPLEVKKEMSKPYRKSIKLPAFLFAVFIGVPFTIGAIFLFILFFVYPSATVKLVVSSQPLVKSVTVKVSTDATALDINTKVIPGKAVDTLISSTKEKETTGEKIIGEKAKGEVTISNKTDQEEKFKKGSTISLVSSKESLRFTLDSDINVPAQTPETLTEPPIYGKANVKVTAEEIGSKYNLDDDKNFKVGGKDTDDFIAENDSKFSNGSSKSVKAVSQEDKTALSEEAFTSAKELALVQLKASVDPTQKVVDASVLYKKGVETFSKNVGDESDRLSITQEVKVSGVSYSQAHVNILVENLLSELIPLDFELYGKDQSASVEFLNLEESSKELKDVNLQVKIGTYIVPKIDEAEIAKNLKGLSIAKAQDYLTNVKNTENFTIELTPEIIRFINRMPGNTDKIEVKVERK